MFYALDKDVSEDIAMANPVLYTEAQQGVYVNDWGT